MRALSILFIICVLTFANEQKVISNILPAKEVFIDLESEACNNECLLKLYRNDMLISFVARFDKKIANKELLKIYAYLLNESIFESENNIIAVILPQLVIKSYTQIITNTLISYATQTNADVSIKFFMSNDESFNGISNALIKARQSGAKMFIAPFTPAGLNILNNLIDKNEIAYVPTINIENTHNIRPNIIFGGVSYEKQIEKLLMLSESKISTFGDDSELSNYLNDKISQTSKAQIYDVKIVGKDINLDHQIKSPSRVNNSSIFLNLPIIKATLIANSLKTKEIKPKNLLATQIIFNPHIINLIDQKDRQEIYIANSINIKNDDLLATNAIFSQDIRYDFTSFASNIGLEYFYVSFINQNAKKLFETNQTNNQIDYNIEIYKSKNYEFVKNDTIDDGIREGLE